MMIDSNGIIIVDRNTANQNPRHLRFRNTNAYAARALVTIWPIVMPRVCRTLVRYWLPSGMMSSALE